MLVVAGSNANCLSFTCQQERIYDAVLKLSAFPVENNLKEPLKYIRSVQKWSTLPENSMFVILLTV